MLTNWLKRTYRLTVLLVLLVLLAILTACGQKSNLLQIGLIKPSLNHLPLQLVLQQNQHLPWQVNWFTSGWELNEALVAGKVDIALLPFTYPLSDVAQGHPVKVISFCERESDALVFLQPPAKLTSLQGKKVGVLRASTLEVIPALMLDSLNTQAQFIPFRTPIEMAAALQAGQVDAISSYVPSVLKQAKQYGGALWFNNYYPNHPCCDIAATTNALTNKRPLVKQLLQLVNKQVQLISQNPSKAHKTAMSFWNLDSLSAAGSLAHTVYQCGLDTTGINFEQAAAKQMLKSGYLSRIPTPAELYENLN